MRKTFEIVKDNDYILSLFRKTIVISSTVVTTSILTRYLGPKLKGEYSYYFSIVHMIIIVTQMGFFNLYAFYKRKNEEKVEEYFFSIVIVKFFLLLIMGIFFSYYLIKLNLSMNYILLPYIICIDMLQGELLFFLLIDKIKKYNYVHIVVALFNVCALTIVCTFSEKNLLIVIIIYVVKDVIAIILCFICNRKQLIIERKIFYLINECVKIVIFPVFAALLLDMNYKADIFFLKGMSTNYLVGIYSAGVAISEIAWMIPDVFKEVLFNKTAKDNSIDSINICLRISNTIMIFVFIGIVLGGKLVIWILYGKEYLSCYKVVIILLLGVFSMSVFKILNPLYQATGKWIIYTVALGISVGVNCVLNAITIPLIDIYGAAISSVISYSFCGGLLLFFYIREYHVKLRDILIIRNSDIKELRKRINDR